MPCENCNTQFTVFKRKKSCLECRRLFCNNCLVKRKGNILCEKCVIFKKRPLSKIELLKLKPKDLIFYLQSKHISTTGCVEKEELVNLIIAHVNSNYTENLNSPNYSTSSCSSPSFSNHNDNTFDSIKQTCQSLFTSFTERIANDLNLDLNSKQSSTSPSSSTSSNKNGININCHNINNNHNNSNNNNNNNNNNIYFQPRHSTTNKQYDSSCNSDLHSRQHSGSISSHLSVGISPTAQSSNDQINSNSEQSTSFNNINVNNPQPGPSGQNNANNLNINKNLNQSSSSSSSFEELGAVGGVNTFNGVNQIDQGGGSCGGGGTSSSDTTTENWHFVQKTQLGNCSSTQNRKNHSAMHLPSLNHGFLQHQKITRRRSDSFIIEQNLKNTFEQNHHEIIIDDTLNETNFKRSRKCCIDCKLKKIELKNIINKFREQLDHIKYLNEMEKQKELEELLKSIENRCLDDCPNLDQETSNSTSTSNAQNLNESDISMHFSPFENSSNNETLTAIRHENGNDIEGIYVYPTMTFLFDEHSNSNNTFQSTNITNIRHRLKLTDITSKADLKELSVKQLKEILMLNRVDFKGCCEKTELLERVYRLWIDYKSTPAVEKLTTEDLCKICMDAPIECVILECGHMVTCTNCGKVLNECPICRQYIVRVVRFFRA